MASGERTKSELLGHHEFVPWRIGPFLSEVPLTDARRDSARDSATDRCAPGAIPKRAAIPAPGCRPLSAPDFCQRLLKEFPGFDQKLALNEFGEVGRKAVQEKLPQIGPAYRRLDDLLRSSEFLAFLSASRAYPELLYDPAYVGGGTHENLEGQDLDVHVDFNMHPKTHTHRRLNLILFSESGVARGVGWLPATASQSVGSRG